MIFTEFDDDSQETPDEGREEALADLAREEAPDEGREEALADLAREEASD